MRTLQSCKVFTTLFILFSTNLSAFSQDPGYPIYHDTLIVGDTCILRQESGYCDPGHTFAILSPDYVYWPEYCPECRPDTFLSFRTEIVPGLDTSFYFYFILPLGALSGRYGLIPLCDGYTMPWWSNVTVYTTPIIWIEPRDTAVCAGDVAIFSVTASGNKNEDLIYEWYHNDITIGGFSESYLTIENAAPDDTGTYFCVISNQFGTDTTQEVRLGLHPFPGNPGVPAGPERFCSDIQSTTYTIASDPLATGYSWQLFPEEAGTIQHNDTSCTITWDRAFSGSARLCVELISGNCGRNTSDTLEITVPGISVAPEICIVGIDGQSGKYRIIWERSSYGTAQLFRIYRESNQADVYLEIGTVDTSEMSFFVDSTSVPDVLSHRYKLSYLDSCGSESEMSPYHQTMHLVANIGTTGEVNLSWTEYGGTPFPTYTIYRGSHPDSMSLFIQVPSTVTSYKDIDPPIGYVYYQIGMSNPAGCDPVNKSVSDYSSSMSNLDQVLVTGVNAVDENKPYVIFPNPVSDVLQIQYNNVVKRPIQFTVYNSLGEAVLEEYFRESETKVDVSSLSPGIYILQMIDDSETHASRFVIRRK
jgi:hypothetical protein